MNNTFPDWVSNWLLPPKVFEFLTQFRIKSVLMYILNRHKIRSNVRLKNIHSGKRCFIVANGPSTKKMDLKWLRNELVFSVSSGYLMSDFNCIRPSYHCLPQLTYGLMDEDVARNWFSEMHEGIGDADLFLEVQERPLVEKYNLFPGRRVNYLCMGRRGMISSRSNSCDLTSILPRVQTVPCMVIMIALYMGFKEIILVGVDHDWFVTKKYQYSFNPTILKGLDSGVTNDGRIETLLLDDLPNIRRVWSQYRALRRVAESRGVQILNATLGGMLDEFPRVDLKSLEGGDPNRC